MEPGPLSHRNKSVVEAARLHRAKDRRERGETLIEGPHLLDEALSAGADIHRVFYAEGDNGIMDYQSSGLEAVTVDERALRRLAGTETPRGPVAVVAIPPTPDLPDRNLLVSWGVSDPGNVGTMIRSAAAFGWGFGYAENTADPWSPKVLRAGAGLQFSTWIGPIASLPELRSGGFSPLATVVSGGNAPDRLANVKTAVLIGEEAWGLPDDVVAACDGSITVPMPGGAESLNAAVAAAIVVYEMSKHAGENPGGV